MRVQCWHGGVESVEDLKAAFKAMILEHCTNPDWREVKRSLQELTAPHYHHEFVKQALAAAFERPKAINALVDLLQRLYNSGVPDVHACAADGASGHLCPPLLPAPWHRSLRECERKRE